MKQTISLNERELHRLISESVKRVLKESNLDYGHVKMDTYNGLTADVYDNRIHECVEEMSNRIEKMFKRYFPNCSVYVNGEGYISPLTAKMAGNYSTLNKYVNDARNTYSIIVTVGDGNRAIDSDENFRHAAKLGMNMIHSRFGDCRAERYCNDNGDECGIKYLFSLRNNGQKYNKRNERVRAFGKNEVGYRTTKTNKI